MADDFYSFSARQRLQQINSARAQSLADLEQCKASADYEGAAASVQQIANLEAERQNLINLHDQYVRSQTPVEPPEPTPEERHARAAPNYKHASGTGQTVPGERPFQTGERLIHGAT